jgi:hypothetical protein
MVRTHAGMSADEQSAPSRDSLDVLAGIFRAMTDALDAHAEGSPEALKAQVAIAAIDALRRSVVEDSDRMGGSAGLAWILHEVREALDRVGIAADAQ